MNTSHAFFELMNSALGKLKSALKNIKLRVNCDTYVPALNMEAFWLAYPGRTPDLFTILPRFNTRILTTTKSTSDEFLKLLFDWTFVDSIHAGDGLPLRITKPLCQPSLF